jgi:branched-chain amino acid transport system ATP-binding protein
MPELELELSDVNTYLKSAHILFDVSLALEENQFVVLIGRNGAGKTTTLETIAGINNPKTGSITFKGEDIAGMQPHEVSRRGIALIPEDRRIFPQLTVRENLHLSHYNHRDTPEAEKIAEVFEYFPRLEEREDQKAGQMSGGEQQMLAIGRALVTEPDILLVDEPTEGLMPKFVEKVSEILERISEEGVTVLLVEQNIELALEISDYGYVIDEGRITAEGPSSELRTDQEIREQYLGF